ncbi:hypothetical protein DNK06_13170 [Pseudomonas daroniae]|uniref:Uncharacterized protein n=1 Tax=Phytopseudomonas daroniae TaxID=2487519 RepID=A0A4Q9QKP5_9GAMM|nr:MULTISPECIES: hypothetical protein [Pseudomonas]TBU79355.1 hypothetical protein DNK06_13170 [Pseudomonas daroniae]TBU79439.1 hypothetical protein DNK31_19385 [Pseudomonas sp. FRB 228]TBU91455.1 hypothetical protein DNJ99_10690 [Pseudomonas daroniae]
MADSSISIGKVITTSTSFVDKAVEFRHFMLLISFLLALDSCLMIFYKKNLLQSFDHLSAPEVSVAGALVFLGIFAFLMALFFPVLRHVLLAVTTWIKYCYPTKNKERDHDFRYPSTVRREALIERDKLIIELLEKQDEQKSSHETNMNIGFGLVIMFAVNYLILGTDQALTLAQTAATVPGIIAGFWISLSIQFVFGIFIIFLLVVLTMSLTPDTNEKFYLPESDMEKAARTERERKMKSSAGVHLD